MKNKLPLILLALTPLIASPAIAAKKTKAATDWTATAKANEGKTVTVVVNSTGDVGAVAEDAPFAVVPVVALNEDNRELPEIPVLIAPAKMQAFIKSLEPKRTGKRGTFGDKIQNASFTATFVTIQGEHALVVGDVKPEMKLKKPSVILAAQITAAKTAGNGEPKPEPAPAPEKPKKKPH